MLNKKEIWAAISDLKSNEIIILPTDTIYGLSAIWNALNEVKINSLKNANENKPLIVLISDLKQLEKLGVIEIDEKEILLKKATTVIFKLNNDSETIAVRLIKRKDIKTIINVVGPIFSTSVNKHGQKAFNKKAELINFKKGINVYFDKNIINIKPSKIYNSITKQWIR